MWCFRCWSCHRLCRRKRPAFSRRRAVTKPLRSRLSASIYSTEYYRLTRVYGTDGKRIWQDSPGQRAKNGVPDNYRQIILRIQSRLLDNGTADRISKVWRRMLLDALHPSPPKDEEQMVCDGVSFHFSMPLAGHGLFTAHGHPYENHSRVRRNGQARLRSRGICARECACERAWESFAGCGIGAELCATNRNRHSVNSYISPSLLRYCTSTVYRPCPSNSACPLISGAARLAASTFPARFGGSGSAKFAIQNCPR